MNFLEKNFKLLAAGCTGLLLIGLIWMFSISQAINKEIEVQEKFAKLEANFGKYKDDLNQLNASVKSKAVKTVADKKTDADSELAIMAAKTKLLTDLEMFISSNEKNVATSMAGLFLSELLMSDKKINEALAVLNKVKGQTNDLTSILVQKKIGALLADNNQCDEAMKIWNDILKIKTARFAYSEVKILQSLCYQKNNDLVKAEEILNTIKNDKSEGSADSAQHAEKILRLIHFKKASGT